MIDEEHDHEWTLIGVKTTPHSIIYTYKCTICGEKYVSEIEDEQDDTAD